jgi:hypothetical protein
MAGEAGALAGRQGGTGLSGGNRASGIDTRDDLRDFHQIMAVQASREQKAAYEAMLSSTRVASAEVEKLVGGAGNKDPRPDANPASGNDKGIDDALEIARALNKRFLEGFSETQKTGLKEVTKRLNKADAELVLPAKILEQEVTAKASSSQISGAAQNLARALSTFQRAQLDLGEEMSCVLSNNGEETSFNLPVTRNTVNFANQAVAVTTTGVVAKAVAANSVNIFSVKLTADLSDLQQTIVDVLRTQLDKTDQCGEQIGLRTATLTPQGAAGVVVTTLHYERWTCNTMFGKPSMNELVEGNGTIEVKLTPVIAENGTLRLAAQIGYVNAEGMVAELLRSGALGEALRDKISAAVLSALQQGGDLKTALPTGVRDYASLKHAQFQGTGSGRLIAVMDGEIRVSDDNLIAVTHALSQRSSPTEAVPVRPELVAR